MAQIQTVDQAIAAAQCGKYLTADGVFNIAGAGILGYLAYRTWNVNRLWSVGMGLVGLYMLIRASMQFGVVKSL